MTGSIGSGMGPIGVPDPYEENHRTEETTQQKPSTATRQVGVSAPPSYPDALTKAEGNRLEYRSYTQDFDEPQLPLPNDEASTEVDEEFLRFAKKHGIDANTAVKLPNSDIGELMQKLNEVLNSEYMQEVIQDQNPEIADLAKRGAIFSKDPKFASLAEKALQEMGLTQESAEFKGEANQVQKELEKAHSDIFTKTMKKYAKIEEYKALQFAYNTRGEETAFEKLTTEQVKLYEQILSETDASFKETYKMEAPLASTQQAKRFMSKMELDYDHVILDTLRTAWLDGSITKEQKAELKSFHYFQGEGANQETATLYKNITDGATIAFFAENGLPKNVKLSPKAFLFQAEICASLREAFDSHVETLGLSKEQKSALEGARENYVAASQEGKELFNQVLKAITPKIRQELALPAHWQPLIGEYNQALDKNIGSLDVSDSTKEQLRTLLQSPPLGGASTEIEELLSSVVQKTIEEMVVTQGVPKGWMPVSVARPTFSGQLSAFVENTIQVMEETQQAALTTMESIPPDEATTSVFMDYLKAVSEALDELQQCLYALQMASINCNRNMSIAQQDLMANSIANQAKIAKKQKKMERKARKAKKGGKNKKINLAIKIVAPVAMAAMMAAVIVTGGLAAPFLVPCLMVCGFMLANSVSHSAGGPDLMEGAMDGIGKLGEMIGGEQGRLLAQGIAIAAVILICVLSGNPLAFMVGMSFAMEMMMADNFLFNASKECGASDQEAMIAMICVLGAFMLACMAGGAAAAGRSAGTAANAGRGVAGAAAAGEGAAAGAAAGTAAGAAAARQGATTLSTAEKIKQLGKVAAVITAASTVAQGGYQVEEGLAQYRVQSLLAQLQKILGDLKARQEEIEAMINLVQQVMQTLVDSLGGVTEQIAAISQLQGKKYEDASTKWVINQGA
jgi:hypothetical protein